MPVKVLAELRRRLDPLARKTSPLSVPPPRSTRFGSPLVLSRVHWLEPKLVAEITYLTWTADNLLRHTVYVGLREDNQPSRCGASSKRELVRTRGEGSLHFRRRYQLKRPIRFRPVTGCPVMAGDEIHGRGPAPPTAFAAQAQHEIFKGHVAFAFDQQPRAIADRSAAAMQLNHAVRPVREPL
jgi:hypothetical protein